MFFFQWGIESWCSVNTYYSSLCKGWKMKFDLKMRCKTEGSIQWLVQMKLTFSLEKKKKGIECGISLRVILARHLWYKRSIPLKQGFGIYIFCYVSRIYFSRILRLFICQTDHYSQSLYFTGVFTWKWVRIKGKVSPLRMFYLHILLGIPDGSTASFFNLQWIPWVEQTVILTDSAWTKDSWSVPVKGCWPEFTKP